jgi:hypothetical protein
MTVKEELLQRLRQEKDDFDRRFANIESVKAEWVAAVGEKMRQFRAWLDDAEQQGLIRVEDRPQTIHDDVRLGPYPATVIRVVSPSGRSVEIRPRARFVAAGEGRIDFDSGSRSVALLNRGGDRWEFRVLGPGWNPRGLELSEDAFWQVLSDLLA